MRCTMDLSSNIQSSATDAGRAPAGLHPVTLHARNQTERGAGDLCKFLLHPQAICKAVQIEAGIHRPEGSNPIRLKPLPAIAPVASLWRDGHGSFKQCLEAAVHLVNASCCCRRSCLQSCRNTLPSMKTLTCSASEKSISMKGLRSCLQKMYRHAAATCKYHAPLLISGICTSAQATLDSSDFAVQATRGRRCHRSPAITDSFAWTIELAVFRGLHTRAVRLPRVKPPVSAIE